MNKFISQYIKTARRLFPILGKPEKTYLKKLGASIEDFFTDHPPDSVAAISAQFGPPEEVMHHYLDSVDPDYLIQRIQKAKRWRLAATCSLVVLCAAVVLFSYLLWVEYTSYTEFMDGALGYMVIEIE